MSDGPVGRRLGSFVVGPRFARRLTLTHAIDDFGDAMVNLSLVGSLFFSVSLDASRSRILLYLVLTAAPLAIAAPVVGNALDRTRYGYRIAISGSQVVRAAASVALIGSLLSVALYPLAFVVLVCRKVYALGKIALLSQMTNDRQELLQADTHIARTGTVVGGAGTVAGGVLLATGSTDAMLLLAAAAFVERSVRLAKAAAPDAAHSRRRSSSRMSELIPPRIWSATIAVTAIRAAAGALTYLLAFAIKRGGGDEWIYAAGLLVGGVGGLLATLLASRLHRWLEPDGVLVLALLVPGLVCAIGVVTIGNFGILRDRVRDRPRRRHRDTVHQRAQRIGPEPGPRTHHRPQRTPVPGGDSGRCWTGRSTRTGTQAAASPSQVQFCSSLG